MSAARWTAAALLAAGCGYFPEVVVDLTPGPAVTAGTLQVCPTTPSATGCEGVAGGMGLDTFGVPGHGTHAGFVFDRTTPTVVRVVTALGWADYRLPAGGQLQLAAGVSTSGAIVIDCANPAMVCGSARAQDGSAHADACRAPPPPCP